MGCMEKKRGAGEGGQVVVPDPNDDSGPIRPEDERTRHPRPYCESGTKFHTYLSDLTMITEKINRKFEEWTCLDNPDAGIPEETDQVVRSLHWARISKGFPSVEEFILQANREIERRSRGQVRHDGSSSSSFQLTTFVEEMTLLLKEKDRVVEEFRKIIPQFLLYV